ncbi:tetratricopeptide repeat protein [Arenimonas sp.]|uniref:tetratricopeptide repeat protein n=1 Tax=Arenimonas sp. TaxID=1872635 RepID=UPI0039E458C5
MLGKLIAELRRRNVIRMAGLYLVAAWLITQVAGTVLPMFGAPDWIARSVVVMLAICFLPALIFAWVFELTPEGLKRDAEVPAEESIAPQTARRMDRMIIVVLLLALSYFALDKFVLAPHRAEADRPRSAAPAVRETTAAATAPAIPRKSIAVLAFADLSPGKDQEYFSDGMAEEILNALAQVKDLKVAGRTSSFQFKNRNVDLREIGRTLGVAHVLEGSVRKQDDKVRITAQLIQASDGSHLWSKAYDGDLSDVFELQENIARAITDELQVVLEGEQKSRLVPVATKNPEAYGLFLQATAIFDRRDGTRMQEAGQMLEQAIALDPDYARAYSRLAAVYGILPTYFPAAGNAQATQAKVEKYAQRAIALDPALAEPWAVMGLASSFGKADLLAQREYFDRALQLDPDDITTNFWSGLTLMRSGYYREGVARLDHGLAIDPLLPNLTRWRAAAYLRAGDEATAEPMLKRAQAAGLKLAGRELAEIEGRRGHTAEARRLWIEGCGPLFNGLPPEAATVLAAGMYGDASERGRALAFIDALVADPKQPIPGLIPLFLAQMGQEARALEVDRTRLSHDNSDFMVYVFSPAGASLRARPEFPAYLDAKGFPALWAKYGQPDSR